MFTECMFCLLYRHRPDHTVGLYVVEVRLHDLFEVPGNRVGVKTERSGAKA